MDSIDSADSYDNILDAGDSNQTPDAPAGGRRSELPWPAAGDRVLQFGEWYLNACMPSKWTSDRWHYYIEGYRRGAEVLMLRAEETTGDLDVLVYPFVFLWRQHIELQLKRLISYGRELSAAATQGGYPKTHGIVDLWREARSHILREEPNVQPECAVVDTLIAELGAIDPDSFDFRYPENKKGHHTLAGIPMHINFGTFHAALLKLSTFLGCGIIELGSRVDYIREREAEMRAEYESDMRSLYGDE